MYNVCMSAWFYSGTITSLPTFEELFPDPDVIRDLLYQFGLPAEIVEGFLQMVPQIDQVHPLYPFIHLKICLKKINLLVLNAIMA